MIVRAANHLSRFLRVLDRTGTVVKRVDWFNTKTLEFGTEQNIYTAAEYQLMDYPSVRASATAS